MARAALDALLDVIAIGVQLPAGKPGADDGLATGTLFAMLSKAAKTYRGTLLLCEHGLGHEGNVMLRCFFETAAACRWFLRQPDFRRAAWQMRAHDALCFVRMTSEAGAVDAAADVAKSLPMIQDALGDAFDKKALQRHYSKTDFKELCKSLGWEMHYSWIFRAGSSVAHVSDLADHLRFHDDGRVEMRISPGPSWVSEVLAAGMRIMGELLVDLTPLAGGAQGTA